MKRPILMIAIGYIIGIIEGLYFKESIVSFYIFILVMYVVFRKISKCYHEKIWKIIRYKRYIKLYMQKKAVIYMIIAMFLGNIIILKSEKDYLKDYNILNKSLNINIIASVDSMPVKKGKEDIYICKIINIKDNDKDKNNILYIKSRKRKINIYVKEVNEKFNFGDIVEINGEYKEPKEERNYKGFNQKKYYKSKNILGDIKVSKIKKIKDCSDSKINIRKNAIEVASKLKNKIKNMLSKDVYDIYIAMILGDKTRNR